jgi:hypothetical protein
MKALLLILLFQLPAYALNETFLRMSPNNEYMSFALKRYLGWHRTNFKFPPENLFLEEIVSGLDHWTITSLYLRQLTITHSMNEAGKLDHRIRVYVRPELRSRKELKGTGLPQGKELWFVEWDNDGKMCEIFKEDPKSFSSWCRGKNDKSFVKAWDERISNILPKNWKLSFPVMGHEFLQREKNGVVYEIMFFEASPHPSIIPEILRRSAYLHTKETLFPFDRMSSQNGDRIGIHYP